MDIPQRRVDDFCRPAREEEESENRDKLILLKPSLSLACIESIERTFFLLLAEDLWGIAANSLCWWCATDDKSKIYDEFRE